MKYRAYTTDGTQPSDIKNEILYIIASARASDTELVKITVGDGGDVAKKNMRSALRFLKEFKTAGKIQLYATKDSFLQSSVEAQYLLNKYGEYVDHMTDPDTFVFIKI